MSLLSQGEAWLRKQRQAFLSEAITYTIASTEEVIELNACQAETDVDLIDTEMSFHARMIDWIVEVADLNGHEPVRGDVITRVSDGIKMEVCEAPGEKEFRISGRDFKSMRIHTKQKS